MDIDKADAGVDLGDELKRRAERWKEANSECRSICPKESATRRRISMELTRALSEMRRP